MHEKMALALVDKLYCTMNLKALQDVGTSAMQYSVFVYVSYIFILLACLSDIQIHFEINNFSYSTMP